MCSIITKYPNVWRSDCLVMVVMRTCILIISLIQNVAIVSQVQASHSRKPCSSLRGNDYLSFPIAWRPRTVSLKARERGSENREGTHSWVYSPGSTDLEDLACLILRKAQKVPEKQQRQKCHLLTKVQSWPKMTSSGQWLFWGPVSGKTKASALISM